MGRIGASLSNNVALPVVAARMSSLDELISALNFMDGGSVDALPTPVLLRLASIGDTCSIETTKFDGNTPIFAPSFPFHQPSSTCWGESYKTLSKYNTKIPKICVRKGE